MLCYYYTVLNNLCPKTCAVPFCAKLLYTILYFIQNQTKRNETKRNYIKVLYNNSSISSDKFFSCQILILYFYSDTIILITAVYCGIKYSFKLQLLWACDECQWGALRVIFIFIFSAVQFFWNASRRDPITISLMKACSTIVLNSLQ